MVAASIVNALIVEDNVPFRRAFKGFLLERYPFLRIVEAGSLSAAATQFLKSNSPTSAPHTSPPRITI